MLQPTFSGEDFVKALHSGLIRGGAYRGGGYQVTAFVKEGTSSSTLLLSANGKEPWLEVSVELVERVVVTGVNSAGMTEVRVSFSDEEKASILATQLLTAGNEARSLPLGVGAAIRDVDIIAHYDGGKYLNGYRPRPREEPNRGCIHMIEQLHVYHFGWRMHAAETAGGTAGVAFSYLHWPFEPHTDTGLWLGGTQGCTGLESEMAPNVWPRAPYIFHLEPLNDGFTMRVSTSRVRLGVRYRYELRGYGLSVVNLQEPPSRNDAFYIRDVSERPEPLRPDTLRGKHDGTT